MSNNRRQRKCILQPTDNLNKNKESVAESGSGSGLEDAPLDDEWLGAAAIFDFR
ncbi:hypothetical protein JYU34_022354 [Plutella xylostella]|uniref:Uncharacterized protein n=1 Tax=Plutella xylostella TaxID=51655 RepID=A0ABQ7PRB1_PLUXY|nr:hypothetical protein JYU34_022354 [Plutella xylostella]